MLKKTQPATANVRAMSGGWDASARAWIEAQGEHGDYGRAFVLDSPMIERIRERGFKTALDVGCGEGRFCRIMQTHGIATVGIDPTSELVARARELDPIGDYRIARIEDIDIPDEPYDLVVCYLSLIDIPNLAEAVSRMVRFLRPGGTFLIANLTSFNTAGMPHGWIRDAGGALTFGIDNYLEERAICVRFEGLEIDNWHRPLGMYMSLFLELGMQLTHYAEPVPNGGDPARAQRYRRVPWFDIMEWRKPD